jgi:hypothetical protein
MEVYTVSQKRTFVDSVLLLVLVIKVVDELQWDPLS